MRYLGQRHYHSLAHTAHLAQLTHRLGIPLKSLPHKNILYQILTRTAENIALTESRQVRFRNKTLIDQYIQSI